MCSVHSAFLYLYNRLVEKLAYDWIVRYNEIAFNRTSPRVRLGSLSSRHRSQGCLPEAAMPGQVLLSVPWRGSCTNEIMFQRTSRPSSRGTSNDKRTNVQIQGFGRTSKGLSLLLWSGDNVVRTLESQGLFLTTEWFPHHQSSGLV